jgi:hypothetical protein
MAELASISFKRTNYLVQTDAGKFADALVPTFLAIGGGLLGLLAAGLALGLLS